MTLTKTLTEEEYYRLRLRTLSTSACVICGFRPNLRGDYQGQRLSVKKQTLGAHFRKHWNEVMEPKGKRLPWYMCPVDNSDFRRMFPKEVK